MTSYLDVVNNLLDPQIINPSTNPNIPKMPIQKSDQTQYLPFYEYKQPWRSSYYESTGISQQKLDKTINDLGNIPPEYSNIQPLLNENLTSMAIKYSKLVTEQNLADYYAGRAGIETFSLYNGYRLSEGISNNTPIGYQNYIRKFNEDPAFIGLNGYPDIEAMKNTFRPCRKINENYVYSDTYDESIIYEGVRCSPRMGYLTMPVDRNDPTKDKTFSFFANSSQRVPMKVHPDIVKIVQEYLPVINNSGFFLFEKLMKYRESLPASVNSQSGKLFLDSLVIFKVRNRFFLLPNLAY